MRTRQHVKPQSRPSGHRARRCSEFLRTVRQRFSRVRHKTRAFARHLENLNEKYIKFDFFPSVQFEHKKN